MYWMSLSLVVDKRMGVAEAFRTSQQVTMNNKLVIGRHLGNQRRIGNCRVLGLRDWPGSRDSICRRVANGDVSGHDGTTDCGSARNACKSTTVVGVSDPVPPISVAEANGLGGLLTEVTRYSKAPTSMRSATEIRNTKIGLAEADYRRTTSAR